MKEENPQQLLDALARARSDRSLTHNESSEKIPMLNYIILVLILDLVIANYSFQNVATMLTVIFCFFRF